MTNAKVNGLATLSLDILDTTRRLRHALEFYEVSAFPPGPEGALLWHFRSIISGVEALDDISSNFKVLADFLRSRKTTNSVYFARVLSAIQACSDVKSRAQEVDSGVVGPAVGHLRKITFCFLFVHYKLLLQGRSFWPQEVVEILPL